LEITDQSKFQSTTLRRVTLDPLCSHWSSSLATTFRMLGRFVSSNCCLHWDLSFKPASLANRPNYRYPKERNKSDELGNRHSQSEAQYPRSCCQGRPKRKLPFGYADGGLSDNLLSQSLRRGRRGRAGGHGRARRCPTTWTLMAKAHSVLKNRLGVAGVIVAW
jgi:hypothetical protein